MMYTDDALGDILSILVKDDMNKYYNISVRQHNLIIYL